MVVVILKTNGIERVSEDFADPEKFLEIRSPSLGSPIVLSEDKAFDHNVTPGIGK
jgi:hypothetical protein